MTTYLPVPDHLAYAAWVRVKQGQLVQLASGPEHGRIEAARWMAAGAHVEPVVTLVADLVPVPGGSGVGERLRVQMATFERGGNHGPGDGLLVPGVHSPGRPECSVLAVGAGPSPDRARTDLFGRVAALLRVRQDDPAVTKVVNLPPGS